MKHTKWRDGIADAVSLAPISHAEVCHLSPMTISLLLFSMYPQYQIDLLTTKMMILQGSHSYLLTLINEVNMTRHQNKYILGF